MTKMTTSPKGKLFIQNFEGIRLKAYQDSIGVWTIGIGTTRYPNGEKVKKDDTCTKIQVQGFMSHDLQKFENGVNRLVKVPLNQNQFDALVSFTYNLGEGNLASSTLLRKLNIKDYIGAANEFPRWNRAGKVLAGLTRRREAEKALFLS